MDQRRQLQLWRNKDLVGYVREQAKRHFSCIEDQEDAADEAFEKIAGMPNRSTLPEVRKRAYRAINAMYRRKWRERKHRVHINESRPRLGVHG